MPAPLLREFTVGEPYLGGGLREPRVRTYIDRRYPNSIVLDIAFAIEAPSGATNGAKFCKVMNFTSATRDAVIPWKALRPMLRPGTKNGLVAWYFYRDFTRGSGEFIRDEDAPDVPYYMLPDKRNPFDNLKRRCRRNG